MRTLFNFLLGQRNPLAHFSVAEKHTPRHPQNQSSSEIRRDPRKAHSRCMFGAVRRHYGKIKPSLPTYYQTVAMKSAIAFFSRKPFISFHRSQHQRREEEYRRIFVE